jgi:hypothetical protein
MGAVHGLPPLSALAPSGCLPRKGGSTLLSACHPDDGQPHPCAQGLWGTVILARGTANTGRFFASLAGDMAGHRLVQDDERVR